VYFSTSVLVRAPINFRFSQISICAADEACTADTTHGLGVKVCTVVRERGWRKSRGGFRGNSAGMRTDQSINQSINHYFMLFFMQMLREYGGDGNRSGGNPAGWNLFLREPCGDALEILQTIKIQVQALQYQVNCPVKCLTWPVNM